MKVKSKQQLCSKIAVLGCSGSVLDLNPTKAFGFSVEGWCTLKKGICPLPFQKNKFEQYHLP